MTTASTKINNLQAVRAFAALVVVFFHTGFAFHPFYPIGSCGVDIFFALSGYIMARICAKDPRYFLRRRIIRIVPPYWLLTLLLFFAAVAVPRLMGSTSARVADLLRSLFFIPFFKESGLVRPLLFVGWSLNYEMLFYLAIALSLLLWRRRAILLASIILLTLHFGALAFSQHLAILHFLRAYYVVEFPLGALAYYLAKKVPEATARRWRMGAVLLIASAVCGLSFLELVHPNVQPAVLGPAMYDIMSSMIVLGASLLSQGGWDTRLVPLILVGDASYVLYLIHPYCEYLLQRLVVPHIPFLRIDHPVGCVLAIAVSVAAGLLLHLYGERPTLAYLNNRFGGHRRSAEFRVVMETKGQVNP